MPDSEEGTRRRLEDVRTLLPSRESQTRVGRVDRDTRAKIHDRAEQKLVRKLEDSVRHDCMALVTRRDQSRSIRNRWIPVVESPE